MSLVNNHFRQAMTETANVTKSAFETILQSKKKVATRKTINSLEIETTPYGFQVKSNKSLLFIERGRKKGAKRPVYKSGGVFKLFPDLEEWKVAVDYQGSDYMLAKGISERGIPATPILDPVSQMVEKSNEVAITKAFGLDLKVSSVLDARDAFRGL